MNKKENLKVKDAVKAEPKPVKEQTLEEQLNAKSKEELIPIVLNVLGDNKTLKEMLVREQKIVNKLLNQ